VDNRITISDQINVDYRKYALYVIQSRGIPNFYDALTPVQRLILQNSPSTFKKTVGVIGEVFSTGLYHHGDCFLYNTRINIADGTHVLIGDWAEKFPDFKLLVYCVDENGEKTTSLGHSPRVGQITDEMFEIELENGEIFRCTKNHPFLTKRGWIKAEDLLDSDEIVNI
jgi:DNA gyrase subunit A